MTVRLGAEDPPRWLQADSDVSSELRELAIEASLLPDDDARIARLRERLGPWLAAGIAAEALRPELQAPSATVSAAPSAAGATIMAKAAALALATSVSVASVLSWLGPDPEPLRGTVSSQNVPPAAAPALASAPPLLEARSSVPDPKPIVKGAQSADVGAQRSAPTASRSATITSASLAEQTALLSRARNLLDVAPAEALELLSQHARRFPSSTLMEERRLFTIHALARAGRTSEAQRELERFERSSPSSPHLSRARRILSVKSAAP